MNLKEKINEFILLNNYHIRENNVDTDGTLLLEHNAFYDGYFLYLFIDFENQYIKSFEKLYNSSTLYSSTINFYEIISILEMSKLYLEEKKFF